MAYQTTNNIIVENATIIFKNFSGVEKQCNRAGNRNFCLIIDDESYAKRLLEDGWNVKVLAPRDEDEPPRYYIPVTVSFSVIPPRVFLVTRKKKTQLDEDSIGSLDYAEIKNVDLTVRPYNWELNGRSGIKAYLKNMYATIEEDEFADKYADDDNLPF